MWVTNLAFSCSLLSRVVREYVETELLLLLIANKKKKKKKRLSILCHLIK